MVIAHESICLFMLARFFSWSRNKFSIRKLLRKKKSRIVFIWIFFSHKGKNPSIKNKLFIRLIRHSTHKTVRMQATRGKTKSSTNQESLQMLFKGKSMCSTPSDEFQHRKCKQPLEMRHRLTNEIHPLKSIHTFMASHTCTHTHAKHERMIRATVRYAACLRRQRRRWWFSDMLVSLCRSVANSAFQHYNYMDAWADVLDSHVRQRYVFIFIGFILYVCFSHF